MAEATAFRNNVFEFPCYALPWTIVFPLLDADGDPISPSSPDSEKSLNGDTFADCTNEATEIATSTGVCYLTLTAAEMTADIVAVRIQSTGAKTTVMTLYPRKLVTLLSGTGAGGTASTVIFPAAASSKDSYYNGCLVSSNIDGTLEYRMITSYVGSTRTATVTPAWVTASPDSNDAFVIYDPGGRLIEAVAPKAVWDELLTTTTYNLANSAGLKLRNINADIPTFSGTATAGTANTITAPAGASATNDVYVGQGITLTGGTGVGQTRRIINYVGSTKVITVDRNWVVNPDATTTFDITASAGSVIAVEGQIVSATATTAVIGSEGSATNSIYNEGVIAITSGTGAGQYRDIISYVGATKTVTVAAWNVTPDATSGYAIVPSGASSGSGGASAPTVAEIAVAVWAALLTAHTVAGSFGAAIDALPTNAELATALGTADDAVLVAIAALNNLSSAQVATVVHATALTEAYRANGATGTLPQLLYEVLAHLSEASVVGTTKTTKKLDHATPAATYTLDANPDPTSVTRAT